MEDSEEMIEVLFHLRAKSEDAICYGFYLSSGSSQLFSFCMLKT